jgi:hypothetical protein
MSRKRWHFDAASAAIGTLLGIAILELVRFVPNVFASEVAAAWVQAIGSIAAIVAATSIARSEHRRAEAQRQIDQDFRRQVFAFDAVPHVENWHGNIVRAWMLLPELTAEKMSDRYSKQVLEWVREALDSDSYVGYFTAQNLLTLDDEGIALHRAIRLSAGYLRLWDRGIKETLAEGENFDNLISCVRDWLAKLGKLIDPALARMRSIAGPGYDY